MVGAERPSNTAAQLERALNAVGLIQPRRRKKASTAPGPHLIVSGASRILFHHRCYLPLKAAKEMSMTRQVLKFGAVLTLLLVSSSAYADDPTGVLLSEQWANQSLTPKQRAESPAFSDVGPCQPGMQSEPFPNHQGYRCVRKQP